jgi:hypothetical protein
MSKKPLRLVDRLKALPPQRKHGPKTWLERLPPDVAREVVEAKAAWRAGEFERSGRSLAAEIHEDITSRGFNICGMERLREWLSQD